MKGFVVETKDFITDEKSDSIYDTYKILRVKIRYNPQIFLPCELQGVNTKYNLPFTGCSIKDGHITHCNIMVLVDEEETYKEEPFKSRQDYTEERESSKKEIIADKRQTLIEALDFSFTLKKN